MSNLSVICWLWVDWTWSTLCYFSFPRNTDRQQCILRLHHQIDVVVTIELYDFIDTYKWPIAIWRTSPLSFVRASFDTSWQLILQLIVLVMSRGICSAWCAPYYGHARQSFFQCCRDDLWLPCLPMLPWRFVAPRMVPKRTGGPIRIYSAASWWGLW